MEQNLAALEIDMDVSGVDKKLQQDIFKQLRSVDGIEEWLRATMAEDVKRHFSATSVAEQALIKGAYFRTRFILAGLRKVTDKKNPEPKTRSVMKSTRHAT